MGGHGEITLTLRQFVETATARFAEAGNGSEIELDLESRILVDDGKIPPVMSGQLILLTPIIPPIVLRTFLQAGRLIFT
jgi:hypothetical protein